jgi:hypothetical protein
LEEWRKTALNLARKYKELLEKYPTIASLGKLRTQGRFFYGACKECTFSNFCDVGRPLDKVEAMLKLEPWSPYEDVVQESQTLYLSELLKKDSQSGSKATR